MIDEYLAFATTVAIRAGRLIKAGFERRTRSYSKPDGSPVTDVDRDVNALVIGLINDRYPDHAILGEEADHRNGTEESTWICDPLDGTKPFILGVPNSVFMLALAEKGEIVLSVVYDPFTDRLFHALRGQGAYCNGDAIRVSDQSVKEGYVVLGTDSYPYVDGIKRAGGRVEPVSGSGYKSMMIARGLAVATLRDKADFHDVAPAALVIEEAGGRVTALDGSPLALDRPIGGVIMSNDRAHAELVEIVRRTSAGEECGDLG